MERADMATATPPPDRFAATRESLRALACFAISPALKARTGRIGLRSTGDGFGTPPFADGSRIVVRGDELIVEPGVSNRISTVRAAAELLGVELSADPGVGRDLPPFTPDDELDIDVAASRWLGAWYAFGARQLSRIRADEFGATISEAQLWPEHFDIAVTIELGRGGVNVGVSPGDAAIAEPYAYVGPHDLDGLRAQYWNAPFGAALTHTDLRAGTDPDRAVAAFYDEGLRRLAARDER
jgi:hypothetical protein